MRRFSRPASSRLASSDKCTIVRLHLGTIGAEMIAGRRDSIRHNCARPAPQVYP